MNMITKSNVLIMRSRFMEAANMEEFSLRITVHPVLSER